MTTSSDRKTDGRPSLGTATGQRIPVPRRERKPAMAALAVLLIVGGALISAYLVMVSGQRVPVISIAQPVAAGQRIPASALREVQVSSTGGLDYIPWGDRAKVTQTFATVTLVKGALLTNGMISTGSSVTKGSVVVGLALKPGQLPAGGLQPGDRVALYAVSSQGGQSGTQSGTVLAPAATVYDVVQPGQNDIQADQISVSVTVPVDQAPEVTQASSAGAVAVALLPAGEKAPQTAPRQTTPKQPSTQPSANESPGNPPASPRDRSTGTP
ncbi:hypothetical protein [Actinoallomurus iriomotensis]|uniref:Flagellar protein FlgA n=1 Tax=Actinoallomurus iriomotensis TaxID=478107 RepID=A0A9W6VQM7_9ACTN|nr:hypothetical protein [Actinoallomurus iriomotensis]GLY76805.1 flagellar protein FlgA [Actinoallomurus iriomotensis]